MSDAFDYLEAMYFLNEASLVFHYQISTHLNSLFYISFTLGLLFCLPVYETCRKWLVPVLNANHLPSIMGNTVKSITLFSMLYLCVSFLAVHSYNPFIYFRF